MVFYESLEGLRMPGDGKVDDYSLTSFLILILNIQPSDYFYIIYNDFNILHRIVMGDLIRVDARHALCSIPV